MYTTHGHQIPGTPVEGEKPELVARCGGPGLCTICKSQCAHPSTFQDERPFQEVPTSPILQYFVFDHLQESLRAVSRSFSVLAWDMEGTLPPGPEKSTALRKLLEAKDAAVRAALDKKD